MHKQQYVPIGMPSQLNMINRRASYKICHQNLRDDNNSYSEQDFDRTHMIFFDALKGSAYKNNVMQGSSNSCTMGIFCKLEPMIPKFYPNCFVTST